MHDKTHAQHDPTTSHRPGEHGDHAHASGHDHAAGGGHQHHGHSHGLGGHHHAPKNFGRAFAIGIALNLAFVLIEAGFGFVSDSIALMADAGHNLSDVLGLVVAWAAAMLAKQPPSERYTYGLRGSSILAALFNAVFLLLAVGAIGWEAITRLFDPKPVETLIVMSVAGAGIAVNGITAALFASGRHGDINIRGAFLHMAADAAISAGVVVAGLLMWLTGWLWIDPAMSLIIVAVIVWGTWGLLSESLAMSLNAVPSRIDMTAVRTFLASQPGVAAMHDLHIWPMSTTEYALTVHLVIPDGRPDDAFLARICEELSAHHGIGHTTIQIETDPQTLCMLADHAA